MFKEVGKIARGHPGGDREYKGVDGVLIFIIENYNI